MFGSIIISTLLTLCTVSTDLDTKYPEFEQHKLEHKGYTLPYRLMQPLAMEQDKKYPLVLFLHGAGERGDDNENTLLHITPMINTKENREKYPAYVLIPQCAKDIKWVDTDWTKKEHTHNEEATAPMQAVIALLEQLEDNYNIDPTRIYVMGLSMGGFGTWDLLTRYPNRFAAAIPICGGGDVAKAPLIKDLPLWVFHGERDNVVPVECARTMVTAIKEAGGELIKYTEYKGVKHGSWIPALKEPELLEWLFKHQKE